MSAQELSAKQFNNQPSDSNELDSPLSVDSDSGGNAGDNEIKLNEKAKAADDDPTMVLSRQKVAEARADSSGKVYTVFADGCFDMCHSGHFKMLEQAKKALDKEGKKVFLIVGVSSDTDVAKYKGKTVMNETLRAEAVKHCKWVDKVVMRSPWVLTEEFLTQYGIHFVAHDSVPYTSAGVEDTYSLVKEKGMFLETLRTEGISTTDIILQIVRQYDEFIERSLQRGVPKEELNLGKSYFVRKEFHAKEKRVKENVKVAKEELSETKAAIKGFLQEFNFRHGWVEDSATQARYFTPHKYFSHLRSNFKERQHGIVHHSWGLTKAVLRTGWTVMGYFNPISYCRSSKQKSS